MNCKGLSLLELCAVVCITAILGTVATVSYRGYNLSIAKKDLKTHGELFARAVQTCITASGGWEIKHPSVSGNLYPCKAVKTTTATAKDELKRLLNFTCPGPPEKVKCKTHARNTGENANNKYYCLSIEKEVSGKKLQTLVRIPFEKPSDYQILCGENMSAYVPIDSDSQHVCKKASPKGNTEKAYGNDKDGNKITDLTTVLTNPCPWK